MDSNSCSVTGSSSSSSCSESDCSCHSSPIASHISPETISEKLDEIIVENTMCPYHKIMHTKGDLFGHSSCKRHGHCLNPVQCTLFKSCPMHQNGANMFLAWHAKIEPTEHIEKEEK